MGIGSLPQPSISPKPLLSSSGNHPKNHRDTGETQRVIFDPSQTRRHKEITKPAHPTETADHADRRRWGHATFLCVARSRPSEYRNHHSTSFDETPWPSDDGLGTTGPENRFESELSCRFPDPVVCALEERRSRHSSSSFNRREGHAPAQILERREAEPTCLWHGGRLEAMRRRTLAFGVREILTGDRRFQIACRSAAMKRIHFSSSASGPWCLGVLVVAAWAGK